MDDFFGDQLILSNKSISKGFLKMIGINQLRPPKLNYENLTNLLYI